MEGELINLKRHSTDRVTKQLHEPYLDPNSKKQTGEKYL